MGSTLIIQFNNVSLSLNEAVLDITFNDVDFSVNKTSSISMFPAITMASLSNFGRSMNQQVIQYQ